MSNILGDAKQTEIIYTVLLCNKLNSNHLSKSDLKLLSWNVWSIQNIVKLKKRLDFLLDMNIDISCISETWFDADYGVFSTVIKEAGYKMCHAFRTNKSGGGVAIIFNSELAIKDGEARTIQYTSFEYCSEILRHSNASKMLIVCLYRKQE